MQHSALCAFAFRNAPAFPAKRADALPESPPPLAETYKMVRFSMFGTADGLPPLPTAEEVRRVGEWMVQKKMIKAVPAYEDVVAP